MGGEEQEEPKKFNVFSKDETPEENVRDPFPDNLAEVTVVCPKCRNANRPARRNCGFCKGSGMVKKIVTKDELPDDNCQVWGEVDFGHGLVEIRCTGVGEHDPHVCIVELVEPPSDPTMN